MDPEASARARGYASLSLEERKQMIAFKDALGRKFASPHCGWDDVISLPQAWESTVEPDLEVPMYMWPIPPKP